MGIMAYWGQVDSPASMGGDHMTRSAMLFYGVVGGALGLVCAYWAALTLKNYIDWSASR